MAKDPAFLFYSQDFITGTLFMNYEQKGKYITLLCVQHQHGGLINTEDFNLIVGDDKLLRSKFIETEDGFFNKRLMEEMEFRANKSSNLSANAKIRWEKEKQKQCNCIANAMPPEDEDENENEDEIKNEIKEEKVLILNNRKIAIKDYFLDLLPINSSQKFIEAWVEWVDFRKELHKKLTKTSANKQIKFLINQPDPIKCLNQSIQNGWQGLFEVKDGKDKSPRGSIDFNKYERELKIARGEIPDLVTRGNDRLLE